MSVIVLNTLTGAVTEYGSFEFESITPEYAANDSGLYQLGGGLDDQQPIISQIMTGLSQWESSVRKSVPMVYFTLEHEGLGQLSVATPDQQYDYLFPMRPSWESRAQPGRGIYSHALAFGYSNPDGDDFVLSRWDIDLKESPKRRV